MSDWNGDRWLATAGHGNVSLVPHGPRFFLQRNARLQGVAIIHGDADAARVGSLVNGPTRKLGVNLYGIQTALVAEGQLWIAASTGDWRFADGEQDKPFGSVSVVRPTVQNPYMTSVSFPLNPGTVWMEQSRYGSGVTWPPRGGTFRALMSFVLTRGPYRIPTNVDPLQVLAFEADVLRRDTGSKAAALIYADWCEQQAGRWPRRAVPLRKEWTDA